MQQAMRAEDPITTTRDDVIAMIKTIIDPELYIDIWTLGLIYDIEILEDVLNIRMTFTSVACPAGPQLVGEIDHDLPGLGVVRGEGDTGRSQFCLGLGVALHHEAQMIHRGAFAAFGGRSPRPSDYDEYAGHLQQFKRPRVSDFGSKDAHP